MKKYKLKINGNPYDVKVIDADKNQIKIEVNGTKYWVEMEKEVVQTKTPTLVRSTPQTTPQSQNPLKAEQSSKKVTSPLPGTILSVAVDIGTQVKTGDTLLILEAMKMENTIQAESSGKVKAIMVQPNTSVLQGDILLEIE